jgi:hypothetical protein
MNWYIYAINVLSSIILLSTYSFLTFLWFSSDENTTWRKIANQDWITQATTLSSALIRLATGIQATTASCMLASLAIEKGKVPLRELANMSVMRFNSSPLALCWLLLHNVFARGCMEESYAPCLGCFAVLSSLALQFTSTILVTDVGTGLVLG